MSERFQQIAVGGRTGYAVSSLPADLIHQYVAHPETLLQNESAETVKDGDGVLVVRTELHIPGGRVTIAWKRVHRKTRLKQWTQVVGSNRTLQSFFTGHRMLDLGIATARPLLAVVPSRFDLAAPSWLATEWVGEAETLSSCVSHFAALSSDAAARRLNAVATAVGRFVGRLHAAGVSHRDLKPQNLMVRCNAAGDRAEIFAIDLDGVRFSGRLSSRRRWKNLSRLAEGDRGWPVQSRTAAYRFLAAYLESAGLDREHRSAWRELSAATAARIARRDAKRRAA